jgi:hypothetical protein
MLLRLQEWQEKQRIQSTYIFQYEEKAAISTEGI